MYELDKEYTKIKRLLFEKVYHSRLNTEQARAVFTTEGPLLVLAGAGSGKTTVLVNRIAFIINYGNAYYDESVPQDISAETVQSLNALLSLPPKEIEEILPTLATSPCPPYSVLAITFTNKAAKEIKERLARAFPSPETADAIWSGTFHSVCLRILRRYADRLGYSEGFSIYDTDDKKRLISLCMKELEIDEKRLSPKAVANAISMSKDRLEGVENFDITRDPRSGDIRKIYALYQKKLMEYNAVDFDDIIMKTVELLEKDGEVREYYQRKFRYILVDEYQDTNHAQFVLTKLLAGGYGNIMVVGDDDQSIYRFRGATVENILSFDRTYPSARVIKLEENYRSTSTILDAANAVISNNSERHGKSLWCKKGKGERITLRETADQSAEGRYIVSEINRAVRENGRKYSDFAVLYRINELARSLETSFAKSGVPYRILGGLRFYERKEIKDMLAYLSVINSESDNLRLKRIINEPKRKIGDATVDAVEEIAAACGVSMLSVMRRAGEYTALSRSRDKLAAFAELIDSCRSASHLPSEIIKAVFERSGYYAMLEAEGFEGEGRIDNINELIAGAIEYERRMEAAGVEASLVGFLEEISLVSDVDRYDENADAVVLMTIHSAKGLEFPVVFIAGMEDGVFPSSQCIGDASEMSEERRLAYVAITRAKDKLYLTYTKNRLMYGRTSYNVLSTFVKNEIPDTLLNKELLSGEKKSAYLNSDYNRATERRDYYKEFNRSAAQPKPKQSASSFGVRHIRVGARVRHAVFGEGVILKSQDLGGDVLYEVRFDKVGVKRLMATFAKLVEV